MPRTKAKRTPEKKAERPDDGNRPIWKGSISFGLVHIPVTLYSLERRNDLQFHLLDSRDHSRVRYERVNEHTGEPVPWEEIVKGYEYSRGNYVILDDEDFKRADVNASQTVEISSFVAREEIEDVYFDKPYIVVPAKKAEKGYVLLRDSLERTGKVGIAKVVIRTREYLAAVEPHGNALIINLLRFPAELRKLTEFELPSGKMADYNATQKELILAEQLIESMTEQWKPERYRDVYRDALMKWIEKKWKKGEVAAVEDLEEPEKVSPTANVIDLTALLRESIKEKPAKRKRAS